MAIYRLGTRKSDLALTQSKQIQSQLKSLGVECELVPIVSSGDKTKAPLYDVQGASPGLFTKQLEDALLKNTIDLAVHSLKDLPTTQPEGLKVAAICARVNPKDRLVLNKKVAGPSFWEFKNGARIGTSSLRREAQLLAKRKDVKVSPIRGNVPTRLEKIARGDYDGAIFAQAGIDRLGLDLSAFASQALDPSHFVPAPGQGALAIETRSDAPKPLVEALRLLNHPETARCCRLERQILQKLEGGCTLPLGSFAQPQKDSKSLKVNTFLGVCSEKKGGRQWHRFEHFDICGSDDQNLLAQTLAYFKKTPEHE